MGTQRGPGGKARPGAGGDLCSPGTRGRSRRLRPDAGGPRGPPAAQLARLRSEAQSPGSVFVSVLCSPAHVPGPDSDFSRCPVIPVQRAGKEKGWGAALRAAGPRTHPRFPVGCPPLSAPSRWDLPPSQSLSPVATTSQSTPVSPVSSLPGNATQGPLTSSKRTYTKAPENKHPNKKVAACMGRYG